MYMLKPDMRTYYPTIKADYVEKLCDDLKLRYYQRMIIKSMLGLPKRRINMFEFRVDEEFHGMDVNDTIETFLRNGYVITLTPVRYNTYNAIVFEVGDIDESFARED